MIAIEPASAADAQAIAQIHVDAWRAAYVGTVPDHRLAMRSVDERCAIWRKAIAGEIDELRYATPL